MVAQIKAPRERGFFFFFPEITSPGCLSFLHLLQAGAGSADDSCPALSAQRCLYNDSGEPWQAEIMLVSRAKDK